LPAGIAGRVGSEARRHVRAHRPPQRAARAAEYLLYDIASREIAGIQVKSVTFPTGAGEAQVSVYRPALRPSPLTWFVILLEDEGQTAFLPDCAVVPSEAVAGYLAGGGVDGKLAITHGLTGRMAEWRVPVAALGARLGELTAPRE
jgi:hypothetical protein